MYFFQLNSEKQNTIDAVLRQDLNRRPEDGSQCN